MGERGAEAEAAGEALEIGAAQKLVVNYLNESGEIAAFAALPAVLKREKIIDAHDHQKNRARDSITIAAPVVINGVPGNMAAALTKTSKTHYHAHRILMPDGSTFVFENANAEATPAEDQSKRTNVSRPSLRRSEISIAYSAQDSKPKMQQIDLTADDTAAERSGRGASRGRSWRTRFTPITNMTLMTYSTLWSPAALSCRRKKAPKALRSMPAAGT